MQLNGVASKVFEYLRECEIIAIDHGSGLVSIGLDRVARPVILPYNGEFSLHAGVGAIDVDSEKEFSNFLEMLKTVGSEFDDREKVLFDFYHAARDKASS